MLQHEYYHAFGTKNVQIMYDKSRLRYKAHQTNDITCRHLRPDDLLVQRLLQNFILPHQQATNEHYWKLTALSTRSS